MCNHTYKKINDVWVCIKCGLTRTITGKIIFDRKLPNYKSKRRRNRSAVKD